MASAGRKRNVEILRSAQDDVNLAASPSPQPPTPNPVIVIGAGAAGLMAAWSAAKAGARVVLLDSQEKIGAKILVSGGGRCNVTNEHVDASHFHSGSLEFVDRVLRAFPLDDTLCFFHSIGVRLKLEPEMGKLFPVSDSAHTVLDALVDAVRRAGVLIRTGQPVTGIERAGAGPNPASPGGGGSEAVGWIVRTEAGERAARAVVLCTGGLALPKSGSTGAGYAMAGRLGHRIVQTSPALSPLLADCPPHVELSGITLPVRLTWGTRADVLAQYEGSFLFTHTGYSGPAALNVSRHIARDLKDYPNARLTCRYVPAAPDGSEREFQDYVLRGYGGFRPAAMVSRFVPRRVAEMICYAADVPDRVPLARMSRREWDRLLVSMLDHVLPVSGVDGYRKAEATAGGVDVREVDPETLMSRLAPGLFLAGEVLDVDGELGGYNFQWAWSSGWVAGRAAAAWG